MNSRATIQHAKVSGSEYGRESVLTLTLDVRLPTPVEVRTLNEWAATELDYKTRQQIAQAQQARKAGKQKLTKADKKAQEVAHENGLTCDVPLCGTCASDIGDDQLVCLAHNVPWRECEPCEGEGAVYLEPEDAAILHERYQSYVEERGNLNREAILAAQEAALFLLLIKKPVHVSISPAQQAFADLLQLSAPPTT